MASKLKDDHIRWILSLDAKGVQGELQTISSVTKKLTVQLSRFKNQLAESERQMKSAEKEMKRLEQSGDTTSKTYKEARSTFLASQNSIANLKNAIEKYTKELEENNKRTSEIIQTMKIEDMTMSQLKRRADELQKQLDRTSLAADPAVYKALQKELERVNHRMGDVKSAGKGMLNQFASMHNPVGAAARAVQGFMQVLNFLLKHPIIAVIALIVGIFIKLKDALFKNEEAMNSLTRIMAPLKLVFDAILNVVQKLIIGYLKFIETVIAAFSKLLEKIPLVGKYMKEINEETEKAIQLEKDKQTLEKQSRKNMVENAQKETQIAKLRNEAKRKDLYTDQQRLDKLKEAIRLEREISDTKVIEARETLRLLELEASRTQNSTELNQKIAEAKVAVENAEKEQYTHTLQTQREISSTILEMQQEHAEAAKKARENQLKEIDRTLALEINKLKMARMSGIITEKKYNEEVEKLTLSSLKKKMEIKGQEKHQLIQYESDILDAQITTQERADKELLKTLTDEKDKKLQALEVAKNEALAILQEEESDQQIYALRAAELEANTQKAREEVLRGFGPILQQAEFNNNQTRLEAIKDNEQQIATETEKSLKAQENLRKIFAKSTADFDRQYHIKTWEQRKADELRILEKQYKEIGFSEETYRLAIAAIDKKYADEKFRARQQYNLVSMKEMFDAEMEVLKDQYAKKILSEEEFQRAQLQIKLRYAKEYIQKSQEFIQVGSDAVKSIEEAETAKTEAEYAKRQAALTNQYNEGILSQEEYQLEKEKLDYEQRVKELEIQKKYADVNFAMQASQIIASGAVAAINAYSSMAGIPVVGPALGAAAAALVAVTTAMQLAQAKAERDKVKRLTIEAPGSGSNDSAPKTGVRVLKDGFSEGGYNDLREGGYTGSGGKYEVAGYVPVHHGEYVVDTESLKYPNVLDKVRAIEQVRRRHSSRNPLPEGFAEGGSNLSEQNPDYSSDERAIIQEIRELLRDLKTNGVKAPIVLTELQKKEELQRRSEKIFSKED
jgi:hypothetical protein